MNIFDSLQLGFQLLKILLDKEIIYYDEAKEILTNSIISDLSKTEKGKIIDLILIKKPLKQKYSQVSNKRSHHLSTLLVYKA